MGIVTYIKETKMEMTHVTWPTRKQAISYTIAVIIISGTIAYYLGLLDYLLSLGLSKLIGF